MNSTTRRTDKPGKGDSIRTLQKALAILDLVSAYPDGISVKEISDKLSINKATVSKVLSTFAHANYVRQDTRTRHYSLGMNLLYLSNRLVSTLDLRTTARPVPQELRAKTNETVNLALFQNGKLTYIDTVPGNHELKLTCDIGSMPNISSSAVGKAAIAFLPENLREEMIASVPLVAGTQFSIRTREELRADLDSVCRRGYALSREETHEGVIGVGAPIFGFTGELIAALAITGPKARIPEQTIREYGQLACEAGKRISKMMGCDS